MRRGLTFLLLVVVVPALSAASKNDSVFAEVVRRAKTAARAVYQPNEMALPDVLEKLDYDNYRMITFRREKGIWFGDRTRFQVQLFHPGYLYKYPVAIYEVDDGEVQPIGFNPKFFRYPRFDPALLANAKLGFAGLRLLYPLTHDKPVDEIISFVGSSYFRALARKQVYGMSARGLAIDTAEDLPEEFPAFREFWLCKPSANARDIQCFGLLDSASVSGAYRFLIRPGDETIVEVKEDLFFRKAVNVLGLAPLTSMFWRGENDPRPPNDKRPQVHDSDTLLIATTAGEIQSRSLQNVDHVTTQIFPETNVRSFALVQHDRDPFHYLDREANYERRPSVRVESLGDWGSGAVRLMQLPTANEYSDNVVAFWQPQKPPAKGDEIEFKYRLRWFTTQSNKD